MKNIIVVGCGGLAKDIYTPLKATLTQNETIKGFLVDDEAKYHASCFKEAYLGKINDYTPKDNDFFLIAFGNNPGRIQTYNLLKSKNAQFYNFIHPSTILPQNLLLGTSVIIGAFCVIGEESVIEDNVFANKFVNIGHNSHIGESSILCPYAMVAGGGTIGKRSFLSTRSTIAPNVSVGESCTISAHTFIKHNIKNNQLVFNPQSLQQRNK